MPPLRSHLIQPLADPAETSAMCVECAIANPGEAGAVFSRTVTRMAVA
jgi:hypothetical protein